MIYSEEYKFVFYPLPKTGTCSLWGVLHSEYSAVEYPPDSHRGRHDMRMPDLDVADYLFFTIVRHPLARAISLWDHCVRLERVKVDFEEYVWDYLVQREKLQLHFVPRHLWLSQTQCEWLDGLRVDRVLKLESLEEDFNVLPFVQESVSIPHINEGTHKDVAVSGRARDGVYEWAQKDFEEFSFTPLTNPSDALK